MKSRILALINLKRARCNGGVKSIFILCATIIEY